MTKHIKVESSGQGYALPNQVSASFPQVCAKASKQNKTLTNKIMLKHGFLLIAIPALNRAKEKTSTVNKLEKINSIKCSP